MYVITIPSSPALTVVNVGATDRAKVEGAHRHLDTGDSDREKHCLISRTVHNI